MKRLLYRWFGWFGVRCPKCGGSGETALMRYGREGWKALARYCSVCGGKGTVSP